MARKPRVVIPENPSELMKLTGLIYAQHKKLGAKSPLVILDSPNWDDLGPEVAKAVATQALIEEREKELKELYGVRAPYLETFTNLSRDSRDVLLGKHSANPAALGGYGFDVIAAVASGGNDNKPPKA